MMTITQALEDIIKRTPFLEEALAEGIINLSALGRKLKPQIEKKLYKKPTDAAMVMSLKRLTPSLKKKPQALKELRKLRNINLRSNLTEYVFRSAPEIVTVHKLLLQQMEHTKDSFVNLSQGVSDIVLIVNESFESKIDRLIDSAFLTKKINNLASITLRLEPGHVYVSGVLYTLFKSLAWENINVIETISGYTEITIIVDQKDCDRAFSCVKSFIS